MPEYHYKCKKCIFEFNLRHSIAEIDDNHNCPSCLSTNVIRIPLPLTLVKKNDINSGQITREFIEEMKEDLLLEKQKLSNQRE